MAGTEALEKTVIPKEKEEEEVEENKNNKRSWEKKVDVINTEEEK